MSRKEDFFSHISSGYTCKGDYIILGGAMLDGEAVADAHIKIALKTLNRHGLIAGATGTGKTKTLQVFAEQLSLKGIPSLVMDVKGDLSGVARPGKENDFIKHAYAQCRSISVDYGIMEKADNVYVICTDLGWSDLGTWSSLFIQSEHDRNDNVVLNSKALTYNSEGNIISLPAGKMAVVQGLDDYIIIDSGDVLLIVSREQEQNIKMYLDDVIKTTGEEYQ